ncbi:hypothetical protein MK851_12090 [Tenacibaculum sp. 1B UA]|uniref:SPASM domain-containing protein n=1 Tax=Tenacibaculum sp. 1B UA TaxID=2922252 RepID=UPI002A24F25C|nr:SPASM domain-containing protein [Tenacibaculum sp. 1B UA]MDX8554360.1 hypothetical protein [Tenacibaculum sp. 1B UA]
MIKELDELGCLTLQIRFFEESFKKFFVEVMKKFNKSGIKVIELYIEDSINLKESILEELIRENLRVTVVIFSSKKEINLSKGNPESKIIYTRKKIDKRGEEIYDKRLLTSNTKFFCEAKNFNVGLNKKVCIDETGAFKNYISHEKIFGNVRDSKITDIIKLKEFKKKWRISNDMVEKCKDCQFRYMCLSNSDIKEEEGKIIKLNYCNYDL